MLTNKMNLPQSVVMAVMNDPYDRGESDISVTQLISPPYQRKLKTTVEPIEDVSERLWSLYGQIGHGILERAGKKSGMDVENRLFTTVNGWIVSGQYDLIENGVLMDYKFTTFWSVKGDDAKIEWVQQLNLLRLLAIRNGIDITGLRIIALLRDWQKSQAKRDPEYPQLPIATVDIDVWSVETAEQFLLERVKLHQQEDPAPCSDEDRWLKPAVYAHKRVDRKTAIKLYDSQQAAQEAATKGGKDHYVEYRPGEYKRCTDYCGVAHACPQMISTKQTEF